MTKRHAKNLIIEMPDDKGLAVDIAALLPPPITMDIWHEHSLLMACGRWILSRMFAAVFARQIIAASCGNVDAALENFETQTERRAA